LKEKLNKEINLREIGCGGVTGIQLFQNSLPYRALEYTDNKDGSFSKVSGSKENAFRPDSYSP
jgi:hypothetical protein